MILTVWHCEKGKKSMDIVKDQRVARGWWRRGGGMNKRSKVEFWGSETTLHDNIIMGTHHCTFSTPIECAITKSES